MAERRRFIEYAERINKVALVAQLDFERISMPVLLSSSVNESLDAVTRFEHRCTATSFLATGFVGFHKAAWERIIEFAFYDLAMRAITVKYPEWFG